MSTMKTAQTVYYGPSTSTYPSAGSVSKDEMITVKWSEGDWYYIEYSAGFSRKRGYVPAAQVNVTGTVRNFSPSNAGTRYMHDDCIVYFGASPSTSSFASAGTVSYGERIQYLGVKENNSQYAFIEYQVSASTQRKRGWVDTTRIGSVRITPTLTLGQRPSDMNINSTHYTTGNIYHNEYHGECTWFCWGRANEKCGKNIRFNGINDGIHWYANCDAATSDVTKRDASLGPVTNSICSCTGGTVNGHVIFVELVQGGTVYYTEANVGGTNGVVKSCAVSNFPPNRTVKGYLVLD